MKGYADLPLDVADAFLSHGQDSEILHYDGVCAGFLHSEHLPVGGFQLVVVQDCVQRHEDPDTESVGMFTQSSDVVDPVTRCLSGSELRTGDIHSIGTAVDCCDADLVISCRSKQFKLSLHYLIVSSICFAVGPNLGSERIIV